MNVKQILSLIAIAIAFGSLAKADANYFLSEPSNPTTKLEAVRAAMDKKQVYRCNEVQLTEKLTFKNVKKAKSE